MRGSLETVEGLLERSSQLRSATWIFAELEPGTGQQLARSEHATNITHNAIFTHSDTDTEQQLRSQQGEVTSRYNEACRETRLIKTIFA